MTTITFQKIEDIFHCKLLLKDNTEFTIPLREDGYIHATALCKAVKKKPNHWLNLKETKDLVKEIEKKHVNCIAGIPASGNEKKHVNCDVRNTTSQNKDTNQVKKDLIEIYKGGNDKYSQGTWVHPDLGVQLAQWCSPNFSLQVSKWIRELIFTNKVEIGNEKNDEDINLVLTEKLKNAEEIIVLLESESKEMRKKYNKLYTIHQSYLKRKEIYKLREGKCVYLINMDKNNTLKPLKVGSSGSITDRVSNFRTPNPYCKLIYVLYTNENILLESMMKTKYSSELYANNSECIIGLEPEILINDIENMCNLLNLKYTIESQDEIDKFNRNILPIEDIDKLEDPIIEINQTTTKRCGGLKHETEESRYLSVDNFFKNKSNKDGYSNLCKECYLTGRYGDKRKKRKVIVIPKYDILTSKWCNRCENIREHKDFYKDSSTIDGLGANCKICKREQKKMYNMKNKKDINEKSLDIYNDDFDKNTHKKCSHCYIAKEFKEFTKRAKSKDGLSYECKECKKIYRNKEKEDIQKDKINKEQKIEFDITKYKNCNFCKKIKELSEFHKDGIRLRTECKDCAKIKRQKKIEENKKQRLSLTN